ncbi:MAG: DnaJ domain-containing protein [Sphingomonadales bacterium]|nr:DnaJ domain-containing protein [Sphingomonadales bacterium]
MKHDRFHGRVNGSTRMCDWPACGETGEFRAPGAVPSGFDGPGAYRWFCLEHVRQFNAGYDYFAGMTAEDILAAQSPIHGWERESRVFRADPFAQNPRWGDFADPLDAIGAHMRMRVRTPEDMAAERARNAAMSLLTPDERKAMEVLGLAAGADRKALRGRYSELVRRYHPDRNGGDRSFEAKLQGVVEAYQVLRRSVAFA